MQKAVSDEFRARWNTSGFLKTADEQLIIFVLEQKKKIINEYLSKFRKIAARF